MSPLLAPSPYAGVSVAEWKVITERLIAEHPLSREEIVDIVHVAWNGIFDTTIAGFQLGKDIEPQPQIMGFLLHELIPLEVRRRYPTTWRGQQSKTEKDLVHVSDALFCVEIKTSSHANQVFGNRSYGQPTAVGQLGRKGKSGYYLTINFEKFGKGARPELRVVRFGWLDHDDWIAQRAATGQNARLRAEAYSSKLIVIYKA